MMDWRDLRALKCLFFGGEGEIRTREALTDPPVFKTGAFNRSATSPFWSDRQTTAFYQATEGVTGVDVSNMLLVPAERGATAFSAPRLCCVTKR